jgi:predicted amidophosphoribosyltransferase
MLAYFGAPGPLELLIILGMVLCPLVVLIVVLRIARKSGAPRANPTPCPNCGGWIVGQANFCPNCGTPLTPPQGPEQ